jgi:hypothetical protein
MDVSAAGSSIPYSYQAAVAGSGQTNAVQQALASTYSSVSNTSSDGTDPVTIAAGGSAPAPVVPSTYTASQAQQTSATSGIQGLTPSQVVGGLDASAANALLTGLSTGSGLQGFDAAVTSGATLATAASAAQQAYGFGGLTQDAQTQAASSDTSASGTAAVPATGSTSDPTATATYTQQAVAVAQTAAMNNTFSLLA